MSQNIAMKYGSIKKTFCALVVVASATCAGSAFAQSDEYQRGYDAGYRDGAQAVAQTDQDERGYSRSGMVVVENANYGTRDRSCDATAAVQAVVSQSGQTYFVVDNQLCGDPAEHQVKRMVVQYHCGNEASQRVRA